MPQEHTWGVWDTERNDWMPSYGGANGGYHQRQYIPRPHAENAAANENRMRGSWDRFEARDMDANIKTVVDDEPIPADFTVADLIERLEHEIEERQRLLAFLKSIAVIKRQAGVH